MGFQGPAALRVVLARYRRAEVQQGSAPTSAPLLSAAARALGTPGSRASAGQCIKPPVPPPCQTAGSERLLWCRKREKELAFLVSVSVRLCVPVSVFLGWGNARRRRVGEVPGRCGKKEGRVAGERSAPPGGGGWLRWFLRGRWGWPDTAPSGDLGQAGGCSLCDLSPGICQFLTKVGSLRSCRSL